MRLRRLRRGRQRRCAKRGTGGVQKLHPLCCRKLKHVGEPLSHGPGRAARAHLVGTNGVDCATRLLGKFVLGQIMLGPQVLEPVSECVGLRSRHSVIIAPRGIRLRNVRTVRISVRVSVRVVAVGNVSDVVYYTYVRYANIY